MIDVEDHELTRIFARTVRAHMHVWAESSRPAQMMRNIDLQR
jgi:hypothetical protein